jgi:hypothetical protein
MDRLQAYISAALTNYSNDGSNSVFKEGEPLSILEGAEKKRALAIFVVFMSLIAAALFAHIPTKAYSQLPFVPSPNDNNTSSAATTINQSSTTNTTTVSQQQQQQQIEGFSTYQDATFGFRVQYPSDWRVITSDVTPSLVEQNTENPTLAIFNTVSLNPDNNTLSNIRIAPLNLAQYLDSNDVKIKKQNCTRLCYLYDKLYEFR